jgi:hypothetical protein
LSDVNKLSVATAFHTSFLNEVPIDLILVFGRQIDRGISYRSVMFSTRSRVQGIKTWNPCPEAG